MDKLCRDPMARLCGIRGSPLFPLSVLLLWRRTKTDKSESFPLTAGPIRVRVCVLGQILRSLCCWIWYFRNQVHLGWIRDEGVLESRYSVDQEHWFGEFDTASIVL